MAGIDFLADHDAAVAGSQTPIEPDSPSNEYSSTSDEDLSSTYSLTQSILNYPIENGRRYHRFREGSYAFPNDDTENERLDLQYELLKKVYGGRAHFAPLRNPKKILDIGTGTGIWPIEMCKA
ncbi:MAG: hypothetical protein M1833_000975 [Piccolia ochrophora]|nr:MAG: hypothetical protein M1833_000975 [Piccolia ochrophora]